MGRCRYCGAKTSRETCLAHSDLPGAESEAYGDAKRPPGRILADEEALPALWSRPSPGDPRQSGEGLREARGGGPRKGLDSTRRPA